MAIINHSMKNIKQNQAGFIPLLLTILAIVVTAIVLVYLRVQKVHQ